MTSRLLPSKLRTLTRFLPGCVLVSQGVLQALNAEHVPLTYLLIRHMRGDWGRLSDEDWQRNERALAAGNYLLSSYILSTGQKIWMHTTCERSATFVMLPSESLRLEPSLSEALLACQ
ncbi:hypothetical protein C3Z06_28460 [Cupriavidus metallidurans]|nr:hypothetical protein C3Z06_28460 [Cupriavidus metallidurans]